MEFSIFHAFAITALAVVAILLYLILFEPGLPYHINAPLPPCDSLASRDLVRAIVDAPLLGTSHFEVLANGEAFYAAELAAMRKARQSIHIEAYVFRDSPIARRLLAELEARARAGVQVRLVIDAIGSWVTPDALFDALRHAGGDVQWYQPVSWHTFKRFNNRTHRELIIIDGAVGFIGGAGFAEWWEGGSRSPAWRDTMVRVEGPLVTALQSAFLENWLESSGQLLVEPAVFPPDSTRPATEITHALVVASSPSAGKATRARMLFQLLIASARERIQINSPYFLPDASLLQALCDAACRGVQVDIIVPDAQNNHPIARRASYRRYGRLLASGVRLHEYKPAMMHAKILIVDGWWSVVGSTNFDNRSFGLNDEVNLAVHGEEFAADLAAQFRRDLAQSHPVTIAEWAQRPLWQKSLEILGAILERQQ